MERVNKKLFFAVLLFVAAVFLLFYVQKGAMNEKTVKRSSYLMGTIVEITIPLTGKDDVRANEAINLAFDEIRRIERKMSRYIPESEINRLNKEAYLKPSVVDGEIYSLLLESKKYHELTNGLFDITVGPLSKLYRFEEGGYIPSKNELEDAMERVGFGNVVLENGTVMLKKKGIIIDLGGIAKGYAIKRAADILWKSGFKNFLLNGGGDIIASGRKYGKPWKIGIEDPRSEGGIKASFDASDLMISTSGDYKRFFIKDGERYHHIINPKTGKPIRSGLSSVTIAAPLDAEEMPSICLFLLGKEKGRNLLEKYKNISVVFIDDEQKVEILGRLDNFRLEDESE